MIEALGYVQLDSIQTVARAHHMILFTRNQTYRPKLLERLLTKERAVFENWTHDAAIIPTAFYPHWHHRFTREQNRLPAKYRKWYGNDFEAALDQVLDHVRDRGPTRARDLAPEADPDQPRVSQGWWDWHPGKIGLEYHWLTGALSVAGREGFQKVYDLTERVIPDRERAVPYSPAATRDWACREALSRLGFATGGEIAAYFDLITAAESKAWCADQDGNSLIEVLIEPADGGRPVKALARPDIFEILDDLPDPLGRLRVLSPFDPVIRNRTRLERLFGFDYRIEVFVPAAKRKYGYYVFPLLEGDRFVGRIDMKRDEKRDALVVAGLWWEPKVRRSKLRLAALEAELARIARFIGVGEVIGPATDSA